jgi:hypothetical protein
MINLHLILLISCPEIDVMGSEWNFSTKDQKENEHATWCPLINYSRLDLDEKEDE